jgi:hypothetical protein
VEPTVVREGGAPARFVFTRSGSLNAALTLSFVISGTAQARSDYIGFFINRITFPAGAATTELSLATLADPVAEPAETVTLGLLGSSESRRQTVENGLPVEYTVYHPGWELRALGNEEVWAQTSPEFLLSATSSATLTILDGATPDVVLAFEIRADGNGVLALAGPPGTYVIQASADLANWTPFATNVLGQTRWETPVPLGPGHVRRFFKATRQ